MSRYVRVRCPIARSSIIGSFRGVDGRRGISFLNSELWKRSSRRDAVSAVSADPRSVGCPPLKISSFSTGSNIQDRVADINPLDPALVYEMVPNLSEDLDNSRRDLVRQRLDSIMAIVNEGDDNKSHISDMWYFVKQQSMRRDLYTDLLGFPNDAIVTFLAWHGLTVLHAWMVCVRLRGEGVWAAHRLSQALMDMMWMDCEKILTEKIGLVQQTIVSRHMRAMHEEYFAAFVGYDEAILAKTDVMLAEALYRNLFRDTTPIAMRPWRVSHLARLVSYVRHTMYLLDRTPSDLFSNGFVPFISQPFGRVQHAGRQPVKTGSPKANPVPSPRR